MLIAMKSWKCEAKSEEKEREKISSERYRNKCCRLTSKPQQRHKCSVCQIHKNTHFCHCGVVVLSFWPHGKENVYAFLGVYVRVCVLVCVCARTVTTQLVQSVIRLQRIWRTQATQDNFSIEKSMTEQKKEKKIGQTTKKKKMKSNFIKSHL